MVEMFEFEIEKSVYMPGETIKGKLKLKVKHGIKVTSISIRFHGCAEVFWTTGSKFDTIHENKVEYIDKSFIFAHNNEKFCIIGEFSFPFEIQLPSDIPSSLNGYINYYLRACINIPWRLNKKIKRAVEIVKPIYLNRYPHLKQSVTREYTKMISSFLGKSLPVTIRLSIAKSGFVAGENIMFDAFIDNQSSRKFEACFKIMSITTMFASDKTSTTFRSNIAKTDFPFNKILKHSQVNWNCGTLTIPEETPLSNTTSDIVKLNYFVVLRIKDEFSLKLFHASIPITIGTTSFSN